VTGPKVLAIDIETSPDISYHWRRFDENIAVSQTLVRGGLLCYAAKWHGAKRTEFRSEWDDGHGPMVERAHELLSEADVLVHFNGKSFDEKHLNREFALAKLGPPAPYKAVDLVLAARRRFKFTSNKLENLLIEFGLTRKLDTGGFELWREVLNVLGEYDEATVRKARRDMRRYCTNDTNATDELYDELMGWLVGHPRPALYGGAEHSCHCGSTDLQKRGHAYTPLGVFQQWQCHRCGAYSRSGKRIDSTDLRGVA
jgi:DNA polymerase elongation subunit (family B)